MAKPKGSPKSGGRKKGTPNVTTGITKAIIADLLQAYHQTNMMTSDFMALEPRDRLLIAEKLCQYIMPKMQSVSAEVNDQRSVTIEDRLRELSQK